MIQTYSDSFSTLFKVSDTSLYDVPYLSLMNHTLCEYLSGLIYSIFFVILGIFSIGLIRINYVDLVKFGELCGQSQDRRLQPEHFNCGRV